MLILVEHKVCGETLTLPVDCISVDFLLARDVKNGRKLGKCNRQNVLLPCRGQNTVSFDMHFDTTTTTYIVPLVSS